MNASNPVEADPDARSLRILLREELPAHTFERQPLRGAVALALVPGAIGLGWAASRQLPWWACLAMSFLLGQVVTALGIAAHEALHHSVFRSRALENLLGWVGFSPFLVTPGNWRAWHNQAHHGGTNVRLQDPDILPSQQEWRAQTFARFLYAISPGSRSWLSRISFCFLFTGQGQAFLWYYSGLPWMQCVRMHRARERVLTVLVAAGWCGLGWTLGIRGAFFALMLPFTFGNITWMIYIATQHWLQPASKQADNTFLSTASVDTHPVMNWAHFNFSHHQEHHIFPAMSPKFAPDLRAALRAINPRASIVYPHWGALRAVFSRPALYAEGGQIFVAPEGTRSVTAEDLRRTLESTGSNRAHPPVG
jgi:fatty acid desaturase